MSPTEGHLGFEPTQHTRQRRRREDGLAALLAVARRDASGRRQRGGPPSAGKGPEPGAELRGGPSGARQQPGPRPGIRADRRVGRRTRTASAGRWSRPGVTPETLGWTSAGGIRGHTCRECRQSAPGPCGQSKEGFGFADRDHHPEVASGSSDTCSRTCRLESWPSNTRICVLIHGITANVMLFGERSWQILGVLETTSR